MPRQHNQADIVRDQMGVQPETLVEKINVPGLQTLHERPADEIAEILTMIIKSRSQVVEIRYRIGECIELTTLR